MHETITSRRITQSGFAPGCYTPQPGLNGTEAALAFTSRILNVLGFAPPHIDTGKFVRFATSDKRGDRSGWALLFEDGSGGVFGCWRAGINESWQTRQSGIRLGRQQCATVNRQRREHDERNRTNYHKACMQELETLIRQACGIDARHPYVVSKEIVPYGGKQLHDALLIPVRDSEGILRGLQFIGVNGEKKFKAGSRINGCYCRIGKPVGTTILICEGWATGCSLHSATGHAIAVAFSAGNLLSVCEALRYKYPDWLLIICADDDHAAPNNPGLTKAAHAAHAINGQLLVPDFTTVERFFRGSDFNDMSRLVGPDVMKAYLQKEVAKCLI